jgi:hypothetical protein
MSNVIYPSFGTVELRDHYWDQLEQLLVEGCEWYMRTDDDPIVPDSVLLAECMSLMLRVLRSAFRENPHDTPDQCGLVFLDAVSWAAGWASGCADNRAIQHRLGEIAELAGAKIGGEQ